jgi:nucleoside 2-deoxyribosyltransferase
MRPARFELAASACAVQLRAAGFDVFVPREHELALDGTVTAERIFAKDWAALSEANAVLAILDGPVIDDGTACEIGIFYGLMRSDPSKKGIVGMTTTCARRATRTARARSRAQPVRRRLHRGCRDDRHLARRRAARARRLALARGALLLELP